jgi:16S rRNA (cytosine1402-N4)-methyltransferase
VLLEEVLEALAVVPEGQYIDATFGRGGHAAGIVGALGKKGMLLAIDQDPAAVSAARERFGSDPRVLVRHGNFADMARLAREAGMDDGVQGVLMDVGVSSPQLDDPARGFSFLRDGPLDMRMDPGAGTSAAEWLAAADERELTAVIRRLGEERFARRIARAIAQARAVAPIETTGRLAEVVAAAVPRHEPGRHPATRTFQAIRIHVNEELERLEAGLEAAVGLLAPGGRLAVISFHSLEDRIVKRFIRRESEVAEPWRGLPDIPAEARPRLARIGRAVRPGEAEVTANPRSRSAVLRCAERLH